MSLNLFLKITLMVLLLFFSAFYRAYGETVTIVAEDDWYPYSGRTGTSAGGIGVDIVKAAFGAEGIEVIFDLSNYDRGMLLVKDGKAIGCFNAPRTKEIEAVYLWHDEPMFKADSYFYARSDFSHAITGIEDIAGLTLGLTQGYGYGDAIDMNNTINKQYSKTDEIILKKLVAQRVDCIILYDKVADFLINDLALNENIKQVGLSESVDIYLAFSKKHPDGQKYCDLFSRGFRTIKNNGTYQKILDAWTLKFKKAGYYKQPSDPVQNVA